MNKKKRQVNAGCFNPDSIIGGTKYGMMTIINEVAPRGVSESRPNGYRYVLCECDCGVIKEMNYSRIKSNRVKSCGCLSRKLSKERLTGNKFWVGRAHSKETIEKMRKDRKPKWYKDILSSIRVSNQYKDWRNKVYERDNYTCQLTGIKSSGNIEAHHINALTNIVRDNNITTMEQAWECNELWDISNGVTLLQKVHGKFHGQYGHGNNTKSQFEEFKLNY